MQQTTVDNCYDQEGTYLSCESMKDSQGNTCYVDYYNYLRSDGDNSIYKCKDNNCDNFSNDKCPIDLMINVEHMRSEVFKFTGFLCV